MSRWRPPVVIWIRIVKKNQYWKMRRRQHSRSLPWRTASIYGMVLALAGLVLFKVPPGGATMPVSAHLAQSQPSLMDRMVTELDAPATTLKVWINDGMPIVGFTLNPSNFKWHVKGLALAAITEFSGVRLTSLSSLLAMGMPQLSAVSPPSMAALKPRTAPRRPAHSGAPDSIEPGLPGDGGRIWAQVGQDPLVGIYQTHSLESFWSYVPESSSAAYSTDWSKTIVQVGWWLANDLHQEGISAVQSRVDNMSQGLLASYSQSYYTARDLLRWYPTVRILIDLHRADSDIPIVSIHHQDTAKILFIVGTNQLMANPYWRENLAVAMKLAQALKQIAPGILRGSGVDTVPYRYNQQLMPGDVMIEIGGENNSLAEEHVAVNDLAKAIVQIYGGPGVRKLPKAP